MEFTAGLIIGAVLTGAALLAADAWLANDKVRRARICPLCHRVTSAKTCKCGATA